MKSTTLRTCAMVLLAIALSALGPVATAAIKPESDVLLPWFEIDLERHDAGLATTFSIVNASPNSVQTTFAIYTNWGIPVLEVPIHFARTEAKSIDLGAWISHGTLPNRTLTPSELAQLQAALTGKPSPIDGLYYGSPFQDGIAVGYVIVQSQGDRPDALWGDTYSIDLTANYFEAETLTALTHGLKADCKRHGLRFVNQGQLYEAAELIIWSGRRFAPSSTPLPTGPKVKITIGVYDQAGNRVQECHREIIAVEPLMVCHLDITPKIGWLDVTTEEPSFILQHLHSTTQASAELHSYCLNEFMKLTGPGISIEKTIDGDDADKAPGPRFNVGETVDFEYHVANTGTVALSPVVVTDDTGIEVTCPKSSLAAGEIMICKATTAAARCVNLNIGTATGIASGNVRVSAMDVANYEGIDEPAIRLQLLVNNDDANSRTGPSVKSGEPLHWTFIVTNTGNAPVNQVSVKRKNGEPAACPKQELGPGESLTCTAESLAGEGQQYEVATAMALDSCPNRIQASDEAYYFGQLDSPSIEIRKFAGENDADLPPGPSYPVGTNIQWRFIVTNTGNVQLHGVVVADDQGITPTCPKTTLEPGESMICTAS